MCVITLSSRDGDVPESHCSSCDMRFFLAWQRSPFCERPEYCPFCGDEIRDTRYAGSDDVDELDA